jgi:glycosyltransferase involved in cell wall biosynthesis
MRLLVVSPFRPAVDGGHGAAVYLGALLAELALRVDALDVVSGVGLRELSELTRRPAAPPWRAYTVVRPDLPELRGLARTRHRAGALGRWVAGRPLAAAKAWSPTFARTVRRIAKRIRPDVCLVEHTFAAPATTLLRRVCPTILTDHEAGGAISSDLPAALASRDRALWDRHVTRHYRDADLVQAVTPEDAEALTRRLGRPVGVRPITVPVPERAIAAPGSAPARALFFGNFRHRPNAEALAFLTHEVWPRIRARCPDAELVVAGAGSEGLAVPEGVSTLGFVDDLDGLLRQSRLLIAPVVSGEGARIKVLTGLAAGLPVVSTSLGARGITAPPQALLRRDDPEELAQAAVELLEHTDQAGRASEAARAWALEHVSPKAVADAQMRAIEDVLARRRRSLSERP